MTEKISRSLFLCGDVVQNPPPEAIFSFEFLHSFRRGESIKKDNDEALFEIDFKKYGLANRTGVDYQRFDKNRMSKKPLSLEDRKVFPEGQERFKLSSHDTYKAIRHTQKKKKPR